MSNARFIRTVSQLTTVFAVLGLAVAAYGQGSQVTFTLSSAQSGQTVQPGDTIDWSVAVAVAGDNQGLASYSLNLALRRDTATGAIETGVTIPLPQFAFTFGVDGNGTSGAPVTSTYLVGGPAMLISSTGNNSAGGEVQGFGASYGVPWVTSPAAVRMTAGVGRSDRKAALLRNPSGDYVLHDGSFTAPTTPGTYVVTLAAAGSVNVLQPSVDLTTNQIGGFTRQVSPGTVAGDAVNTTSFEFTVSSSGGGGGGGGGLCGAAIVPTALFCAIGLAGLRLRRR